MGFKEGDFPPVDPATFMETPYRERVKVLSRHWAEYGFGAPKVTAVIYVAKLLVLYGLIGATIITATSDLSLSEPSAWFSEPVFWQKLIVWTMLLEGLGLAGSWGPLAGHFKPMTGGVSYWARTGTIRQPPWPDKVPGSKGSYRTPLDVALYLGFIGALVVALALPGAADADVTASGASEGLIEVVPVLVALVLLGLLGLRDKISFLGARAEQYAPLLVFFAFFPFVDMIVAAKVMIVMVWLGAAFSKVGPKGGKHFTNVIPPMVSNTPWLSSKKVKMLHYEDFPEDLRPSKKATGLAHVGGSLVEFATPLVLLFSHDHTLTVLAVIVMCSFHLFIISTFPLAVPLEWNATFMFVTAFLFLGFPNDGALPAAGYDLGAIDGGLLVALVAALLVFPVLGNLRPDLVSFLPSMRQYAGNWATAMWAFAPGAEAKLDEHVKKPGLLQKGQLTEIYGEEAAEVVLHQLLGWRAMHSQGRALNSIMMRTLGPDIDTYTLREAEFSCNALTGFNFGDGHFHDHRMIAALQERCHFEPGEFMVVWIESEPAFSGKQEYYVVDAALGIVERGDYVVADGTDLQPWLPDGPMPINVTWRAEGYERRRHGGHDRTVTSPDGDGTPLDGTAAPQVVA